LPLIFAGRKTEAEIVARRLVELARATAGELSPDHARWMTVVGQLQAEQGDWAGARSTFDRKNAIVRDKFGELDPRYLSCLADSAEALLVSGDALGAGILFEEAEALCRRALDAADPFAIAIRRRLHELGGQRSALETKRIST
jgi:hypothetical protein